MKIRVPSYRRIAAAILAAITLGLGTAALIEFAGAQDAEVAVFDPYVHRSNFVVADLDQAFKVYRDVLGFKVDVQMPVKPDSFMYDVFNIDRSATLRIAFLSSGEGEWGNIGMTEAKGVEIPSDPTPNPSVLIVEIKGRMEKVYEDVKALGLEQTQIYELQNPSRREFIFSDFDGHRVLIMQLHAAD